MERRAATVTLMTVHGAKGLEFEHVVLTGMEEEMFPYKGIDPGERDELEEERRLAYVAITRARKQLVDDAHADAADLRHHAVGPSEPLLSDLPPEVKLERATRGAQADSMRFFEGPVRSAPRAGAFRDGEVEHPQSTWDEPPPRSAPANASPGPGRYVDREYFSDDASDESESRGLRRGARVKHDRFGEGVVREVLPSADPAVVAFFPSWGEKKVLLRYLRLA